MTGKTAFYDFDAWYGRHYQASMDKKQAHKIREEKRAMKRANDAQSDTQLRLVMLLFLFATCIQAALGLANDYDIPRKMPSEKKKKKS